jgi:S-adenosylmethionine-diacylglycerol 3-amino-3-carboxypropyl transferase
VFEDGETDHLGLAIGPGTRLLAICSAGDRPLDAVAWGAAEVIAVDTVPPQLRLAALRIAAAATLETGDLVALFSVGRRPGARSLYTERLRPVLASSDAAYWDRWIDIFEVGLHEHHPLGIALAGTGALLRMVGGQHLARTIMVATDAHAQGRCYERHLRRRYFNPLTRRLVGAGVVLRWLNRDAGARDAMQRERFQAALEQRVSRLAAGSLVRESPLWMPLLAGGPPAPAFETAWLRPSALERIRGAPARIRLVEGSVVDVAENLPEASIDAVALSNVPDWLSPRDLDRLWEAVSRVLVPGGRALVRSALQAAPLPTGPHAQRLVLDATASAELTAGERSALFPTVSLLRRSRAPGDRA